MKLTQCHVIFGPKALSRSGGLCQEHRLKFARLGPLVKRSFRASGDMAFTVPLFDEFMLRAMPDMDVKE